MKTLVNGLTIQRHVNGLRNDIQCYKPLLLLISTVACLFYYVDFSKKKKTLDSSEYKIVYGCVNLTLQK